MVVSQRKSMNGVIGLTLLCLATLPASAALSPKLEEWGKGPAQWIMTSDEQKAWRNVKTDPDAIKFIDLFWARRDPSVGTPVNEFRNEFDSRVAFSDKTFPEKHKRGAMSDRGRVYIVLGAATNMGGEMRTTNAQQGVTGSAGRNDPTGGRQMGARDIWVWEKDDARKFDMPRIEVVFIEDPSTRKVQRDPQRTDFGMANPVAVRKAIISPELTEVPSWAPTGGLDQFVTVLNSETPAPPVTIQADLPATDTPIPELAPDDEPVASETSGPTKLTLLRDGSIDPRSATDPFTASSTENLFKRGDDATWAVKFCSTVAAVPKLKFRLLVKGPLDGKATEQMTGLKDWKPASLASQPGCYVLQGSVPIGKLAPGRYKLTVMIDDTVSDDTFDIKTEFSLE